MEIQLQTLTPLWTGGVDGTTDRLHETGLIGSLRWWYEALVRGLGGYACDPTSEDRCPDNNGKHCAACELFGCTGWARKFRLRVLDKDGKLVTEAIQADQTITLEFLEMRPMSQEEKWLLNRAVWIAATYGALGGKTTLKPQKGPMGEDYGIFSWIGSTQVSKPTNIKTHFQQFRQATNPPKFPNLRHFFFVKGAFFDRLQINSLMGLDEKGKPIPNADNTQKSLRGKRGQEETMPAISKKIFSFKSNGGRIWGYAKDAQMRDTVIERIKQKLGDGSYTKKTGEEVLHEL